MARTKSALVGRRLGSRLLFFAAILLLIVGFRLSDPKPPVLTAGIEGGRYSGLEGIVVRGKSFNYAIELPNSLGGYLRVKKPLAIQLTDGAKINIPIADRDWPDKIGANTEKRNIARGTSYVPWPSLANRGTLIGEIEMPIYDASSNQMKRKVYGNRYTPGYEISSYTLNEPVEVELVTDTAFRSRERANREWAIKSHSKYLWQKGGTIFFGFVCAVFALALSDVGSRAPRRS